jgi:hypothetical protein
MALNQTASAAGSNPTRLRASRASGFRAGGLAAPGLAGRDAGGRLSGFARSGVSPGEICRVTIEEYLDLYEGATFVKEGQAGPASQGTAAAPEATDANG